MQDTNDEHILTPELIEMLAQIAMTEGIKLGKVVCPGVTSYSCRTNVRSEHSRNGTGPDFLQDLSLSSRTDTPSHNVSPSRDSFEGAETVSSCFQLSLSKHGFTAGEDYATSGVHTSLSTGAPTTLMLKNIPNKVSRDDLIAEILSRMPPSSINFFYLPRDFKTFTNFGYSFINCTSDVAVETFVTTFHKRRLSCAGAAYSKPLEVTIARVQGFTANINRLISSPVLFEADEGSLPLIFNRDQVSIPFKSLMQLNRASILFQTRPPIEELIAMVEAEMHDH